MSGPATPTVPTTRRAARVLVLGPGHRVLLVWAEMGYSAEPQRRPDDTGFWALPGGGVEPGESYPEAALRELHEETGIVAAGPLPLIARREATFRWDGRAIHSLEQYFLARVASDAIDTSGWTETDTRWMREIRWWGIADALATEEIVRPPGIIELAGRIIAGNMPVEPVVLPERPVVRVRAASRPGEGT